MKKWFGSLLSLLKAKNHSPDTLRLLKRLGIGFVLLFLVSTTLKPSFGCLSSDTTEGDRIFMYYLIVTCPRNGCLSSLNAVASGLS